MLFKKNRRELWQSIRGLDLEFNGSTDFDKYSFFNRFIDENSEVCLQRIKLRYVRYEDNTYNETTIDTASKQKIQHLDVGYVDPKRRYLQPFIHRVRSWSL